MRYQVEVFLRKQGSFQRKHELDFTALGKTPSKARRNALTVFTAQRGTIYKALTCSIGEDGKLKMLVLKASAAEAQEKARLAQAAGMVRKAPVPAKPGVGVEGRRRTS